MANDLTVRENQTLSIALSESSRKLLVSAVLEIASPETVRKLATRGVFEIKCWLDQQRSRIAPEATQAQVSAHLAKLIPHYWQPDMTDAQMRSRFLDFCSDLKGVTENGMAMACAAYRRDAKSKFFPTPGALLALCADDIRGRKATMKAIDDAERALADEAPSEPERVAPLPSAAEVLRKHGKAPMTRREIPDRP